MKLENKTAVVIGASGGIGSVISRRLIDNNSEVIAVGRNKDKLSELNTKYIVCDVSISEQIDNLVSQIVKEHKNIDLLVHSAGVAKYGNIVNLSDEDIDEAFSVNVKSAFRIIRGLLPLMEISENSLVINIGSGAGKIPMRGRSLYCSTKYALRGMSMSLSEEFSGRDPNFVHIALGSTLTDFGPMSLEEKKERANNGSAYFPVELVADEVLKIVENDDMRKPEVVLYPSDYGLGSWKKP